MSLEGGELWVILACLGKPNISLKEVKLEYFKAKELLSNISPDGNDIEASIKIFNKGSEVLANFFDKWKGKKINPTDEELDLLEEALDEASLSLNSLATNYPDLFSVIDNQAAQKSLKENKWIVLKEKFRREEKKEGISKTKNDSESIFPWLVAAFFFLTTTILFITYKRKRK